MENINELQFIVYTGYYSDTDEGENLHPHNDFTRNLYNKGLEACEELADNEIYDGVCFDNGKPFAQVDYDKYTPLVI